MIDGIGYYQKRAREELDVLNTLMNLNEGDMVQVTCATRHAAEMGEGFPPQPYILIGRLHKSPTDERWWRVGIETVYSTHNGLQWHVIEVRPLGDTNYVNIDDIL